MYSFLFQQWYCRPVLMLLWSLCNRTDTAGLILFVHFPLVILRKVNRFEE